MFNIVCDKNFYEALKAAQKRPSEVLLSLPNVTVAKGVTERHRCQRRYLTPEKKKKKTVLAADVLDYRGDAAV